MADDTDLEAVTIAKLRSGVLTGDVESFTHVSPQGEYKPDRFQARFDPAKPNKKLGATDSNGDN